VNIGTLSDTQRRQDLAQDPQLASYGLVAIFAVVFAAGIALRLWRLGVSPAWQWDEAVYWRVSVGVQHGVLAEHSVYGLPWEPFLYQPPVYFLVVAQWFNLAGASIYHARLLGVVWTVGMQVLLFRLLWRIHGSRLALVAMLPVISDGWLLYIERVSYIENALMVLVVLAFLLYQRALDRPSWQRFAIAGVAVGVAASFKQTGAYVLVAVLLCWLVIRREHRGHFILLGVAVLVIAVYLIAMTRMYDLPGRPWFIDQSLTQVRRVLGLQKSGGTLTTPGGALHLLTAQYRYFVPSLLMAAVAILIALRRTWQCYRARDWAPARPNALLYSWLATGVVVFGSSSLKFPQYFVLILVPAYCYLWIELARWDWRMAWKRAAVGAAVVAGIGSFLLTIPAFGVNSLAEVQSYAARSIPGNAIVVTEQSIGDLIQQPWCTVEKADACVGHATYAITWQTYLQSSFDQGDSAFYQLMKGAIQVKSFSGAVGTATVWKLRSSSSSA
jgi:4-amino-4-deoxy-L-arabinose transferase-like glycosyltransferase